MFFVCPLCSLMTKHLLYTLILSPRELILNIESYLSENFLFLHPVTLTGKNCQLFYQQNMGLFRKKQNCNPRQTRCSKAVGKRGNKGEACFLRRKGVNWEGCCELKSTGVTWELKVWWLFIDCCPCRGWGKCFLPCWSSRAASLCKVKSVSSSWVCNWLWAIGHAWDLPLSKPLDYFSEVSCY